MDGSLPGSSVRRVFQAKIREWVAISFSRVSCPPRDRTCVCYIDPQILYCWAMWEYPDEVIVKLKILRKAENCKWGKEHLRRTDPTMITRPLSTQNKVLTLTSTAASFKHWFTELREFSACSVLAGTDRRIAVFPEMGHAPSGPGDRLREFFLGWHLILVISPSTSGCKR